MRIFKTTAASGIIHEFVNDDNATELSSAVYHETRHAISGRIIDEVQQPFQNSFVARIAPASWRPQTWDEYFGYIREAMRTLSQLCNDPVGASGTRLQMPIDLSMAAGHARSSAHMRRVPCRVWWGLKRVRKGTQLRPRLPGTSHSHVPPLIFVEHGVTARSSLREITVVRDGGFLGISFWVSSWQWVSPSPG
jgi:hypothetical protein